MHDTFGLWVVRNSKIWAHIPEIPGNARNAHLNPGKRSRLQQQQKFCLTQLENAAWRIKMAFYDGSYVGWPVPPPFPVLPECTICSSPRLFVTGWYYYGVVYGPVGLYRNWVDCVRALREKCKTTKRNWCDDPSFVCFALNPYSLQQIRTKTGLNRGHKNRCDYLNGLYLVSRERCWRCTGAFWLPIRRRSEIQLITYENEIKVQIWRMRRRTSPIERMSKTSQFIFELQTQ